MKPYGTNDIGATRQHAGAGVPRRRAAVAIILFCVAAALMNGTAIRDTVALKPFGPARRIWLAAAEPLAAVAEYTRLPKIRQQLEHWFHDSSIP